MKSLFLILLLCSYRLAGASDTAFPCLPQDVALDAPVSGEEFKAEGETQKPATVQEALRRLGARCQEGKLFDQGGRQIYFVHLIGCWGNPPEDYQERLALQAQEIERLKQNYTVVEILCGPSDPTRL